MARKAGYWKEYYAQHRERRIAESVEYQRENAAERKEYLAKYYRENRDRYKLGRGQLDDKNARRRQRYATDSEFRNKHKAAVTEWQRSNPDKRLAQRLRPFGLTVEQYRSAIEAQGGGCAICGRNNFSRRLAVDHDHATGEFRGVLCGSCNIGIGKFHDNPERLERAAMYLRASKRGTKDD